MKYETLSRSEENEHGIISAREIISILKHIAENGTRVALYYLDGSYFVMTTLLGVNDTGLWLEQDTNGQNNKRIIESNNLTLVSTHLNVKVQLSPNRFVAWNTKAILPFICRCQNVFTGCSGGKISGSIFHPPNLCAAPFRQVRQNPGHRVK